MNVLDLFSGIGGFSLGLERAGMTTVAFCEIEPFCQKVLRKHWPDVPIFEDVRKFNAEILPEPVDLICGGYPCQPFSLAGKQRGADDDRHLWPEYLRIIRQIHPKWVLAENVAGHINMGLDQVLSDLEDEGYSCWTFIIPAIAVDAPHKRERVWIIANTNSPRSCGDQDDKVCTGWNAIESCNDSLAYSTCELWDWSGTPGEAGRNEPSNRCENMADPNSNRCNKRGKGFAPAWGNGIVRNHRWPTEPGVGRVANGVPSRVDRLRGLGNAVVPQIPEVIGRAIMAIENCC